MHQIKSAQSEHGENPLLYIIYAESHNGVPIPQDGGTTEYTSFIAMGAGPGNEEVEILDFEKVIRKATVNQYGRLDFALYDLMSGAHEIKLRLASGQTSFPWKFSVDNSKFPWIDTLKGVDGDIEEGATTNQNALMLIGRGGAYQSLKLYVDEQLVDFVSADYRGFWTALIADIEDGPHSFIVRTLEGKSSAARTLIVKADPPLPDLYIGSATDDAGNDVPLGGVTTVDTLTFKGKAKAFERGTVYASPYNYFPFEADGQGIWATRVIQLANTVNFVRAISGSQDRTSAVFAVEVRLPGAQ